MISAVGRGPTPSLLAVRNLRRRVAAVAPSWSRPRAGRPRRGPSPGTSERRRASGPCRRRPAPSPGRTPAGRPCRPPPAARPAGVRQAEEHVPVDILRLPIDDDDFAVQRPGRPRPGRRRQVLGKVRLERGRLRGANRGRDGPVAAGDGQPGNHHDQQDQPNAPRRRHELSPQITGEEIRRPLPRQPESGTPTISLIGFDPVPSEDVVADFVRRLAAQERIGPDASARRAWSTTVTSAVYW